MQKSVDEFNVIFGKKPQLDRQVYSQVNRISSFKSLALCVAIFLATLGLAFVGGEFSGWVLAPVSFVLIAGLQSHLLILFHEGAHWMLHPNRTWNDFWTDYFCGAPFFQFLRNYRLFHWNHHRNTGEFGRDPEMELYADQGYVYNRRSLGATAWMFAKDLLGINLVKLQISLAKYLAKNAKENGHKAATLKELWVFLAFWVPVLFVVWKFNLWLYLVVFWILPIVTLTFFLLKLHAYGEHTGLGGPSEFERTWFHNFNPITDFFIYPINSGYHIEHHLFPAVPWYHIRKLRQHLMQNSYYRKVCDPVTADGYFFGETTIFKTMILGDGLYSESKEFQQSLKSRQDELNRIEKG